MNQKLQETAEYLSLLKIPMIVDRSADEKGNWHSWSGSRYTVPCLDVKRRQQLFLRQRRKREKRNEEKRMYLADDCRPAGGNAGGCGQKESGEREEVSVFQEENDGQKLAGLTYQSSMELQYAEGFDVSYYEGGYALIDVHDSARYLVIPEGKEAPEGLEEDIILLPRPLDHIYLAATSAMSLFRFAGCPGCGEDVGNTGLRLVY